MASSDESSCLAAAEYEALASVRRSFVAAGLHGFDPISAEHRWAKRNAELTAEALQPYNDILFTHLKGVIDFPGAMAALMEKIKVARNKYDLCVPLWEYNDCPMPYDYRNTVEYLPHINAFRAGDVSAKRAEVISSRGWRGLVGSTRTNEWYGDTEFHLQLKDIDYIFRKTDLKERLALEFGGTYFTIGIHRNLLGVQTIDGLEYYPRRCEVVLQYYPHSLPADKTKPLGVAALKYKTHVPYNSSRDTVVIENGTQSIARRFDIYGSEAHL